MTTGEAGGETVDWLSSMKHSIKPRGGGGVPRVAG